VPDSRFVTRYVPQLSRCFLIPYPTIVRVVDRKRDATARGREKYRVTSLYRASAHCDEKCLDPLIARFERRGALRGRKRSIIRRCDAPRVRARAKKNGE